MVASLFITYSLILVSSTNATDYNPMEYYHEK